MLTYINAAQYWSSRGSDARAVKNRDDFRELCSSMITLGSLGFLCLFLLLGGSSFCFLLSRGSLFLFLCCWLCFLLSRGSLLFLLCLLLFWSGGSLLLLLCSRLLLCSSLFLCYRLLLLLCCWLGSLALICLALSGLCSLLSSSYACSRWLLLLCKIISRWSERRLLIQAKIQELSVYGLFPERCCLWSSAVSVMLSLHPIS